MPTFASFWGKARPQQGAARGWHPAWAHGLDVAASGAALLRARPRPFMGIARRLGWEIEALEAVWLHLLALHDIGKFSPLFQWKMPEHYPAAIPRPDAEALKVHDPGHPTAGFVLLRAWLEENAALAPLPALFADWSWGATAHILSPILGHHGRPVAAPDDNWRRFFRPVGSTEAAFAYWQAVASLLPPPEVREPRRSELAAASWGLAGLTALADWIGSNQTWFPYVGPATDIDAYWGDACRQADRAVAETGLAPAAPGHLRSFMGLTGIAHPPTDAQVWAATADLPDGPILALIEDVTGGGKTEAALMLAHRLVADGRATGLYFALPTMATANAMFSRIEAIAPCLYADTASPSLTLAHGRADLHPRFRRTLAAFDGSAGATHEGEEGDSAALAPQWLMAESRKALLADLGVGTVDQALLAVLPARYQAVRLAGLAGKVLIVDEAHSYDSYVGAELERLVAFHAAQGGSTIILSATLPRAVKAKLVGAWRKAVGGSGAEPCGDAYPGATLTALNRDAAEAPLVARVDLRRILTVTRVPDPAAALERIRAAAVAGACVAWVRNAVDDAIEGVAALRALGIDADLFHARFAMGDRLAIENRVLGRFGKSSMSVNRRGQVLVATQVVEQSLDLDFDLVVSDLAPIDLLLQRAGRLWRHTARVRPISGPELLVISPDPAGPVAADWVKAMFPRGSAVYADHALLWRTAREIAARPVFRVPEDVRQAIEAIYAEAEDDIPAALIRVRNEARAKAFAESAFARQNLLDPTTGYRADVQAWQSESKVATRLAEESRTIRLAKVAGGRLVPWYPDPDPRLAWASSEVTAYERKLRGKYLAAPRFRPLVGAARAGWSRFDEAVVLLPLEERKDGVWEGVLVNEGGAELPLTYDLRLGLRLP